MTKEKQPKWHTLKTTTIHSRSIPTNKTAKKRRKREEHERALEMWKSEWEHIKNRIQNEDYYIMMVNLFDWVHSKHLHK